MIATVINCLAVVLGSVIGLVLTRKISRELEDVIYTSTGFITLVIGMKMAFSSGSVLILALSVIIGGLLGYWWNVEAGVLRLGDLLKRRFARGKAGEKNFGFAFLNASVLFCAGAMTLIGSFKAGTEGDYTLLLTKSVMDGFMSILMSAAMGLGVAFSALVILVYQGALTLLGSFVKPFVSESMLNELTGVGGVLVLMIGLNLLKLKTVKTANFLPAIIVAVGAVLLKSLLPFSP
jgi:uncharacterized membrane protein YqgA involved in biofilm formation